MARTPIGSTPVLEQKDGKILYESLIVCNYLDEIYPQNPLNPTDPFEKAQQQVLISAFFDDLSSGFYKLISKAENAEKDFHIALEFFENYLKSNFFGGIKIFHLKYSKKFH